MGGNGEYTDRKFLGCSWLEVMGAWRIWRAWRKEIEGGRYRDGKRWHAETLKGLR